MGITREDGSGSRSRRRENDRQGLTGISWLCQTRPVTAVNHDDLNQALDTLGLSLPVSLDQLVAKRRELLHTWYPARYANLTNNPKQYMKMFKQAEEMTRRIEAASCVVNEWLAAQSTSSS